LKVQSVGADRMLSDGVLNCTLYRSVMVLTVLLIECSAMLFVSVSSLCSSLIVIIFFWFRSPSDDYEFCNTGYEISGGDCETQSISMSETVSRVDEALLSSSVSQTIDHAHGKGTSHVDSSDVISFSTSQSIHPVSADVGVKKNDSAFSVPLGKLIRESARASNVRPRDRRRERSVSRARDCLVASKRKTAGLPPVFRLPTDDRVRSTSLQFRHIGMYRNIGLPVPLLRLQFGDNRWPDRASSTNAAWLVQSIKVRVVFC